MESDTLFAPNAPAAPPATKPIVNTIFYPLPEITNANFDQWYKPSMTLESNCFASPPDGRFVPDDFFNPYFSGGKAPSPMPAP